MVSASQEILLSRAATRPRRQPPARVDNLLREGHPADVVAGMLRLQVSYVQERLKIVRHDRLGQGADVTTPKFERHALLVALVRASGGAPRIDFDRRMLVDAFGLPWRETALSPAMVQDICRSAGFVGLPHAATIEA